MPSKAQEDKFRRFSALPNRAKLIELLKSLISAGNLDKSDLGTSWGVTVCPDAKTLVRLNCGNRSLAEVLVWKDRLLLRIFVIAPLQSAALPPRTVDRPGFDAIDGSIALISPLEDDYGASLLADPLWARQFRRHVEVERRRLPNPAWHNPLTESILT
jgi:hypothetical protein